MEIICEKKQKGILVQVKGRLDAVSAPTFEKECLGGIEGREETLVVDLSCLEYLSSAGLRSILVTAKKLKAVGGTLYFCGLTGMVEEVFEVSGMGSMFTVFATADEAFSGR